MYDTAQPYIASYLLIKKDGKYAFVLRENTSWMNGYYGLPAGKVEKHESFTEAAIREAKEEIGIDVGPEDLKQVLSVHRYSVGNAAQEWVDAYFEVNSWRGEVTNAEPELHSAVGWFASDDLPDNLIPSVRAALESIKAGQYFAEYGWDER